MSTIDAALGVAGVSYRPSDATEEQSTDEEGNAVSGTAVVSFVATTGDIEGGTTESVAAGAIVDTDATEGEALGGSTASNTSAWRVVRGTSGGLRFDTADTEENWVTLMRLDPE
jgi:hypothetical protein